MAKVISPLYSVQARGRMGGVVFRRWRNINTTSPYSPSAGRPTDENFLDWIDAGLGWQSLTKEQMDSWRDFADKNAVDRGPFKPRKRSGYITFAQAAYLADQCGESFPTLPPTIAAPNFPEGLIVTENVGGNYEVAWDVGQGGDYIELKGEFNQSLTRRTYDYQLGLIGYFGIGVGVWEGATVVDNRKARVMARILRADGQAGQKGFADHES